MSAVVDASVLVAALVDSGTEGAWAEGVVDGGDLVAPDLALVEATNILRRLEVAGRLEPIEAGTAARDLRALDIQTIPFSPFAERIWELRHNVTSYDAWYVAAAEELDLPLATVDRRLSTASGARCRFLLPPRD
jgi:predicted nucleic acid-binding protein